MVNLCWSRSLLLSGTGARGSTRPGPTTPTRSSTPTTRSAPSTFQKSLGTSTTTGTRGTVATYRSEFEWAWKTVGSNPVGILAFFLLRLALIGYRHLSLYIPSIELDINALIVQNLMLKLKIWVLIIVCKWEWDVRFWPISALMSKT